MLSAPRRRRSTIICMVSCEFEDHPWSSDETRWQSWIRTRSLGCVLDENKQTNLLLCNGRTPKKCAPEKLLTTYSHVSKNIKTKNSNTQKQQIRSHQTWISQVRTVRTASLSTTPCTVPSSAGDPQDSEVLLARIDVKLSWFKGLCTSLNKKMIYDIHGITRNCMKPLNPGT